MSKATHSFSVEIAAIEGLPEAILLQHIHFLQTNFSDGKVDVQNVWVKRSVKAYRTTYPYLTDKQIRGALDRLESRNVIASKIENSANYDRTKSYQLGENGWNYFRSIPFDKRANGIDDMANGFVQKGESYIGSCSLVSNSFVKEEEETREEKTSQFEEKPLLAKDIAPPAVPQNPAPFAQFDIDRAAADMISDFRCVERFAREFKCSEEKANEAHPRAVAEFVEDQKTVGTVYHADRQFRAHYFAWLPKRAAAKKAEAQKNSYQPNANNTSFIPKNVPVFR